MNIENAKFLEKLNVTSRLVDLLRIQPTDLEKFVKISTAASERLGHLERIEATFTNICGAISEMVKVSNVRHSIGDCVEAHQASPRLFTPQQSNFCYYF